MLLINYTTGHDILYASWVLLHLPLRHWVDQYDPVRAVAHTNFRKNRNQ